MANKSYLILFAGGSSAVIVLVRAGMVRLPVKLEFLWVRRITKHSTAVKACLDPRHPAI